MSDYMRSQATGIMGYSFLVAFANDGTLDKDEVAFIKSLALEDGKVDEDEILVLREIFSRVSEHQVSAETWTEIQQFREEFGI